MNDVMNGGGCVAMFSGKRIAAVQIFWSSFTGQTDTPERYIIRAPISQGMSPIGYH
jgi:hypothetical protein